MNEITTLAPVEIFAELSNPALTESVLRARVEHVVLITIDALRADQPWLGYDKVATPNLTRLAQRSLVYSRAYSLSNLTTASLNAMLASRYPSELERDGCTIGRYVIPGSLAPTLMAAGIETVATHGHAIFVGHTAPSLGFGEWNVIRHAASRLQSQGAVTSMDIASRMLPTLPRNPAPKRRFVWAHFVDPHYEYVEHPGYPATSSGARRRYDSEVAFTDAAIGRVLKAIEHNGIDQFTAILVTADHGEAFGEHGNDKHGFSLFEEEIRVPLIVHIPGVAPRRIDEPRSLIDVAPTVAELLGVTVPNAWRGRSLTRDISHETAENDTTVIVDVPAMQGRESMKAVIDGNRKVTFEAGVAAVYDILEDPMENMAILSGEEAFRYITPAREILGSIGSIQAPPCVLGTARGNKASTISHDIRAERQVMQDSRAR